MEGIINSDISIDGQLIQIGFGPTNQNTILSSTVIKHPYLNPMEILAQVFLTQAKSGFPAS